MPKKFLVLTRTEKRGAWLWLSLVAQASVPCHLLQQEFISVLWVGFYPFGRIFGVMNTLMHLCVALGSGERWELTAPSDTSAVYSS